MPSFTATPNAPLPAAIFNRLGAAPVQADVATDEAKTGATYGDLTTVGPSIAMTLTAGQVVTVTVQVYMLTSTDAAHGYMGFAVSGASTLAAIDANAAHWFAIKVGSNTAGTASRETVYTATATGSHTFTAKYRSDGVANMHFADRRIIVFPKL